MEYLVFINRIEETNTETLEICIHSWETTLGKKKNVSYKHGKQRLRFSHSNLTPVPDSVSPSGLSNCTEVQVLAGEALTVKTSSSSTM